MSDIERIVVLAGGLSPEREVSLRSGDRVRDALDEAGIHAVVADADSALLSLLRADPPSAVFPAIHGVCGEDGAGRVGAQQRQQRRVGVRDDRVDSRFVKGVTDPVSGPQRHLPLGGQSAGQDDDTLEIAHDFEILP